MFFILSSSLLLRYIYNKSNCRNGALGSDSVYAELLPLIENESEEIAKEVFEDVSDHGKHL